MKESVLNYVKRLADPIAMLPWVTVLVLGLALAWTTWHDYRRTLDTEFHTLDSNGLIVQSQIAGALRGLEELLARVKQDQREMPALQREGLNAELAEHLERFPEVHALVITDTRGTVTHSADDHLIGFDTSRCDCFRALADAPGESAFRVSQPSSFALVEGMSIVVSSAIRGADAAFGGVIAASLSPQFLGRLISPMKPRDPSGAIMLFNRQGEIIDRVPDESAERRASIAGHDLMDLLDRSAGPEPVRLIATGIDGTRRLISANWIGTSGIGVSVSTAYDDTFAEWRLANIYRSLAFLLTIALAATSVWQARRHRRQQVADLAQLRLRDERAEAMLALPNLPQGPDEIAFLQRMLEAIENLTHSQISFAHFVDEDEQTVELAAWSRSTLDRYCTATYRQHYPVDQAGIWADALRRRQPVILNDYAKAPHNRGLPEGHAELHRLVTVPVIEQGRVVMILGVGNAPRPYSDLDAQTVMQLGAEGYHIVRNRRLDRALHDKLDQLRVSERVADLGGWSLDVASERLTWTEQVFAIYELDPRRQPTSAEVLALHTPESADALRQAVRRTIETGAPFDLELRTMTSAGRLRWLLAKGEAAVSGGEVRRVFGTVQDITLRKEQDDRLRQQLRELEHWHAATLGREGRVIELKREINALCRRAGETPRYPSVEEAASADQPRGSFR